jgi:hypothetical protein
MSSSTARLVTPLLEACFDLAGMRSFYAQVGVFTFASHDPGKRFILVHVDLVRSYCMLAPRVCGSMTRP